EPPEGQGHLPLLYLSARSHERPGGAPTKGQGIQHVRDHRRPGCLAQSRRSLRVSSKKRSGEATNIQLRRFVYGGSTGPPALRGALRKFLRPQPSKGTSTRVPHFWPNLPEAGTFTRAPRKDPPRRALVVVAQRSTESTSAFGFAERA